jgi:hypothetical protein
VRTFADWVRPIDGAYAFRLRPGLVPALPAGDADIRQIAREALADGEAERFAERVTRWSGPEDVVDGGQPYASEQLWFGERPWAPLTPPDVEEVLRGTVRVMRSPEGRADYVLRDHHMLDVALYHYRTTGELPRALFHADRHSDWCTDRFLEARTPAQAATWWALIGGLVRPEGGPLLGDADVFFTTAHADGGVGRDVGASTRVPWHVDRQDLPWERALARPGALDADWVSLDLDDFQPAAQLALTGGLLRDPRFHGLMARARVRVFVLSPQFTNGGEVVPWTVQGSRHSSLRLLNLARRIGG